MNKNIWITIAGVYGFLGVALGAFGAHILKDSLTQEMMDIFKTATYYNLIHSVAILLIGLLAKDKYFKSALFFVNRCISVFFFVIPVCNYSEFIFCNGNTFGRNKSLNRMGITDLEISKKADKQLKLICNLCDNNQL